MSGAEASNRGLPVVSNRTSVAHKSVSDQRRVRGVERRWRHFPDRFTRLEFAGLYVAGLLMVIASILIALRPAIVVAKLIGRALGK